MKTKMKWREVIIVTIALLVISLVVNSFGVWDKTKPTDLDTVYSWPTSIRANWDALEGVLGAGLSNITLGEYIINVQESDYGAKGDGTTNDSVAFQAAIDACPVGGIVFVPSTTTSYRVANIVINKPLTLVGEGFGSQLKAVTGATGYIIKVDGTAAGVVTRTSLGFDGGAHTCFVNISNLYLEGDGRGASIGGLYINQADWGTYSNLIIFNCVREAINCYSGLRESVFENINTRWCGSDTTYPNINLNDQAAVTAESHNNLIFRAIFSLYALGDHVQMDTINGKAYNVRKIRFENCMFHGIIPAVDGAGNNPFGITFSVGQKAFRIFDIGTAEAISITNCIISTMGIEVPGINIETGANGDPTRIRIMNNEFLGRYGASATANDIGIHLQEGELILIGNTIYGTAGTSVTLKTDAGTILYFGPNVLSGGAPAIAGSLQYGNTTSAKLDWQDTNFSNLDGVTIGANVVASDHYSDVSLADTGVLNLIETTTPTANAGYGKIYTKNDNELYFQDGAGVEVQISP